MAISRTNASQAGTVAARTLLALFVVFGLVVFFLPAGPLGNTPAGAQTSSPSPSGPQIQFLNPSGTTGSSASAGPGKEISGRQDTDTAYHLVAWVSSLPSNPTVEFKYQSGSNPDVTIPGTVTQRGIDTFELFWQASAFPPDGSYALKVILYSSGVEVSRDQEAVTVNNSDAANNPTTGFPTSEHQGQTVEIRYPENAGNFGLYRKPGTTNPYHGVIDVTASEGSTAIRAFYTTSRPGTEPSWTRCSSPDAGESMANAQDGVRCNLAAGVDPSTVTAVAAASGDANQSSAPPSPRCSPEATCGEGEDSGDAHRTTPYIQSPTSVVMSPATQRKDDTDNAAVDSQFPCSDVITATVLDQVGRKVAGANVDVHAAGPTDNLFFDDTDASNDQTSAHQPPDRGGHTTEATVDCESSATTNPRPFTTGASNAQGEHEVAGEGDVKHIESAAAGTNDAGAFRFALYNRSTTLTGVTQITAYYDLNDDDTMCSSEPQGDASIGWGADPGTPAGTADETTTCPEPTPTGTSSPTASSTASPSGTASSSPTASQTPGTARTITLTASEAKVELARPVTFSGQIFSSDPSCRDNEFVRLLRRVHGTSAFTEFASATTNSEGSFEHTANLRKSADYQAVSSAHDNCQSAESDLASVLVKAKITSTASKFRPESGDTVRFLGKVLPNHKGTDVILQRKKGGRWVKVGVDDLNSRSRYRFAVKADWPVKRVFRVKWKSQDSDHESDTGRPMRIIIR